jgi:hypothetical protein
LDVISITRPRRGLAIRLGIALTGALCVLAMIPGAAHASTGGGCNDTYTGFGELTACISASGSRIASSGQVDWFTIPPGACSVELDLVNNSNGQVYESLGNMPCGRSSYGPMYAGEASNTYWYVALIVRTSWGAGEATSPVLHLTY